MRILKKPLYSSQRNLRAIILVVLMLSLSIPSQSVFADDPNPPLQETSQEETAPEEEVEGTDTDPLSGENSGQEPVQGDMLAEPPKEEDGQRPDAGEEPPVEEVELEELPEAVVSQLPEGTDLVVVDQEGQVEPLATQEAVESLVVSDPIWCPEGVTPQALSNGCSDSHTSLTDLLGSLQGTNQPTQDGIIWVEKTYDSAAAEPKGTKAIIIDGSTYRTWRDYSLTVQGGWNGSARAQWTRIPHPSFRVII